MVAADNNQNLRLSNELWAYGDACLLFLEITSGFISKGWGLLDSHHHGY